MKLAQEIRSALRSWGSGPVILEIGPGGVRELFAQELLRRVDQTVADLEEWGVQAGDRVAVLLENSCDFISVFLAVNSLGAVPAPLKMDLRSLELSHVYENLQPALTVTEAAHEPIVEPYRKPGGLVLRAESERFHCVDRATRERGSGHVGAEIASINYTYRGYGYPLGAMIPDRQYMHGAEVFASGMGERSCRRMLVLLPMAHIFTLVGCIWAPLLSGMSTVLLDSVHPRKVFETVERLGVDFITAVPELLTFFSRVVPKDIDLSSLDIFASGGSTLSAEDYERVRERFDVELLHGYGLTEFTPVCRNIRGDARPGTVGPLGEGVECTLIEPSETGVGEIAVRVPAMARGYFGRPELTEDVFRGDWFLTGDYGRFDKGHLVFVSEKKRTCKVNGSMVDLREVECAVESVRPGYTARAYASERGLIVRLESQGGSGSSEAHGASVGTSVKAKLKAIMAPHKIPKIIDVATGG